MGCCWGGGGEQSELQVVFCSPEPSYERVLWPFPTGFRGLSWELGLSFPEHSRVENEIFNRIESGTITGKQAQLETHPLPEVSAGLHFQLRVPCQALSPAPSFSY